MLGRAANGVYWMTRYLERAENTARLIDVGFRMALTRGQDEARDEWRSILVTAGQDAAYRQSNDGYSGPQVFNFLLRDRDNPLAVLNIIENARTNARAVRSSITHQVWEGVNESWMLLTDALSRPVRETNLGDVLGLVRRQSSLVRGAVEGSMLRNEAYNFARLGTFIERADNTARILDVKYHVLLPTAAWVGSNLDNAQWETLLRSVAGDRAYRWISKGTMDSKKISQFLILDGQFPRSLVYSYEKIASNLGGLAIEYGDESAAHEIMRNARTKLMQTDIEDVFDQGLHEFLLSFIAQTQQISDTIAVEYRFVE